MTATALSLLLIGALVGSPAQESQRMRTGTEVNTGFGALALSPDGSTLYLGGRDGMVRAVDVEKLTLIQSYRAPGAYHVGDDNLVHFISCSPDGRRIAVSRDALSGDSIDVFDVASGRTLFSVAASRQRPCLTNDSLYYQLLTSETRTTCFPIMKRSTESLGPAELFRGFTVSEDGQQADIDLARSFWVAGNELVTFSGAGICRYPFSDPKHEMRRLFDKPYDRSYNNPIDVDQSGRFCMVDLQNQVFFASGLDQPLRKIGDVVNMMGKSDYPGYCCFAGADQILTQGMSSRKTGGGLEVLPGDLMLWNIKDGSVVWKVPQAIGLMGSIAFSTKGFAVQSRYYDSEKSSGAMLYRASDGTPVAFLASPHTSSDMPPKIAVKRF